MSSSLFEISSNLLLTLFESASLKSSLSRSTLIAYAIRLGGIVVLLASSQTAACAIMRLYADFYSASLWKSRTFTCAEIHEIFSEICKGVHAAAFVVDTFSQHGSTQR